MKRILLFVMTNLAVVVVLGVVANLLGVNRITMVRAIKELREMGLIEQVNGFYCIRDKERMQKFMIEANAQGK